MCVLISEINVLKIFSTYMYVVHTCTYMYVCVLYSLYVADPWKPVFIDRFIGQNTLQMTGQERYLNPKNDVRLPTKQYFHFCTKNDGNGCHRTVYPLFSGLVTGSGKNASSCPKEIIKIQPVARCFWRKPCFSEMSKKCVFWHFSCLVPIFGQF